MAAAAGTGSISGELPALGLRPVVDRFFDELAVALLRSSSLVMVAAEALRFLVWGDVVKDVAQYAVVFLRCVFSS